MRVCKDTTFELSMMPWELEPPRTTLMLVVKGTFAFNADGPATIAEEQVPCLGEVPWDDGDPPSLKTETDYAVLKPQAEWYLAGTAHAPGGRPATLVPVRVRVGGMQKQLTVWGDRVWQRGVLGSKPGEPLPFASLPLRWERSFGGPRIAENPVGRGTGAIVVDKVSIDPLPNIEDPSRPLLSRDDRLAPAGMFPIPSTWRARVTKTGTYDERWKASRWPFFPKDFDFSFFLCAPPDQRREGYWRGDEEIELSGLHAERTRIKTRLPGLRARVFIERASPRPPGATPIELLSRAELEALGPPKLTEVALRLDTIVIDADACHAMCQWRGLVEVADARLTDVARIFVVHEPVETNRPHPEYEAWLLRKLCEEADDFEIGGEPEAAGALALVDGTAAPETEAPPLPTIELAHAQVAMGLSGFLGAVAEMAPPPKDPDAAVVRERYAELGLPPDLLPDPEVADLPEIDDPPSLLRLAAIIRRKLGKPFRELDLSNAPYQKLDLSGVDFADSILTGACFVSAVLRGSSFDGATLARADMSRADMRAATFRGADLSDWIANQGWFDSAVLDDAAGSHAVLTGSRLQSASLLRTDLEEADLTRCDFRSAHLDGADLTGATLDGADLSACSMADTSLEAVHAHDAVFERCKMPDLRASDGADFTRARFVLVDAPGAQLQGAILADASFAGSNLEGADFSDARAQRVNLHKCVLKGACFDRADLTDAVLLAADLFEASLSETELGGADARGAHLFSANLWRARTSGALLEGAVLDRTLLGEK